MTRNPSSGQGLVEVALVVPVLLLLLAGGYVCCRASFLHAAAESAAQTEALRAGRRLPGVEGKMADAILPQGRGVNIRTESGANAHILPAPFPSLAGRTKGNVGVTEGGEGSGGFPYSTYFPPLQVLRISEASVDCWEKSSASGKKIRGLVAGIVATGVLR